MTLYGLPTDVCWSFADVCSILGWVPQASGFWSLCTFLWMLSPSCFMSKHIPHRDEWAVALVLTSRASSHPSSIWILEWIDGAGNVALKMTTGFLGPKNFASYSHGFLSHRATHQSSSTSRWDFPWTKPSSYGSIPIYGNPQIIYKWEWGTTLMGFSMIYQPSSSLVVPHDY